MGYRTLLTMAALVVVVAGLRASGELLLPFLVAAFLSILAAPPLLWLERRRWPAWAAVTVVLVGVVAAISGFAALLITSVSNFRDALPRYKERLGESMEPVRDLLHRLDLDVSFDAVFGAVQPSSIIDMVSSTLSGLVAAMVNTSLVLLLMIFVLLEAAGFPRKLRAAMDDPLADLSRWAKMMTEIQHYLVIKTMVSLVTGLAIGLWTWAWGVDFPILWGLTAFLLNYIPNVGSIIAAVPAVLVAAIQLGLGHALGTGAGYLVVNTVMGNLIEPQLMGRHLGLSPLVVFLSLVFWGFVWGPVGMLLSVPLTMVIKIMLEKSDDLRWVGVLLGSAPPAEHIDPSDSLIARIRRMGKGGPGEPADPGAE